MPTTTWIASDFVSLSSEIDKMPWIFQGFHLERPDSEQSVLVGPSNGRWQDRRCPEGVRQYFFKDCRRWLSMNSESFFNFFCNSIQGQAWNESIAEIPFHLPPVPLLKKNYVRSFINLRYIYLYISNSKWKRTYKIVLESRIVIKWLEFAIG